MGKLKVRKRFVEEAARAFGVGYLYANLLGNEAGRLIYDGDTLIAAGDNWLAEGSRFSFQEFVLSTAIIDIKNLRLQRASLISSPKIFDTMEGVIDFPYHDFPKMDENPSSPLSKAKWEDSATLKEEEFTRAVALGLLDYCRKSHSKGFVLNLSGGADSSACVCLVYLMVELGIQELGLEAFQKKFPFLKKEKLKKNELLAKLLFCLYQATQNNQESTWHSAKTLADTLAFPLAKVSIESIVEKYCDLIEPMIDRDLNWQQDDVSLQNIQARSRAPSVWLLANIRGALLISTTNRSEVAAGYLTMDGDSCGSISPIAGIDKSFILQWLHWLEKEGPLGIGCIPALKAINALTPTAELRPPELSQSDEADLMPFAWLDMIERLFVRDKCSPKEILFFLQQAFPKASLTSLATAVERFFGLWSRSQWKRERLAITFHLDDHSLDPKTWCRFPILSGGFKEALQEMWASVG